MDDVAVPLLADHPWLILSMIRQVFETAFEAFTKFRFRLNFAIGKSNAILRIAGPGSEPVRQQLMADNFNITCSAFGTDFVVPVVDAYGHLGRIVTPDLNLRPDINARGVQCVVALKPISRQYFRHAEIELMQKKQVAASHLFSISLVGASGWHVMRPRERKLLHARTMAVWRSVTASHYAERVALDLPPLSDQKVLDQKGSWHRKLWLPWPG